MAKRYLEKYGRAVIDAGYDICFIKPGSKAPVGKDWEDKPHGPKALARALDAGRGDYGIGIKTYRTPGVDIDCYDKSIVKHMIAFTQDMLGKTIQRVGLAPKTLLVYRAAEEFAKVQSATFIDDEDRKVKLEVLADGQQFVAFHTHPDTGEPYRWIGDSPLDVAAEDLPEITREDAEAIVAEFERQAKKAGWPRKSSVSRKQGSGRIHENDPFASDKPKIELSPEELLAKLHSVPNAEDYDTWFHVGMALYHQYDGGDEGRLMWHEWSSQAPNYDMDALDAKWDSFDIEGKRREPITARFILKLAKEEDNRVATEELEEIKDEILTAKTVAALESVMDRMKSIAFTTVTRESLVALIKDRVKKVSGSSMAVSTIRRLTAFENPDHKKAPAWLKNWVFDQSDETFYNIETRQKLSTKSFDLSFGRYLLTKKDVLEGVSTPETSASHIAVHRYHVPTVAGIMYHPKMPEFFEVNGLSYANGYSDATVPPAPDSLSKTGKKMVQRVLDHLDHLFDDDRDKKLLLSWLAYIVQTGERVNWAIVIQGVEGDGKSYFGDMLAAILGGENVNMTTGEILAEKYTAWAEGAQVLMVEEVRLHGLDRFAIINKVKPYITNTTASIRRMRADAYKVVNTVSYLLLTNHKDGVPVGDSSNRFFPLFSQWQVGEALESFKRKNPDYYRKLHETLQHGDQLRRWLLDYELHPDFNAKDRAKESAALAEMKYLNRTDVQDDLREILEQEIPGLSRDLLDSAKATEALVDAGCQPPYGQAWKRLLSEAGFTFLGRFKVNGRYHRFWSQTPKAFKGRDGKPDGDLIRAALEDSI